MIKTTTAITSSKWIRPPPTCPRKPRSQRTIRIINIVQSISLFSVSFFLHELCVASRRKNLKQNRERHSTKESRAQCAAEKDFRCTAKPCIGREQPWMRSVPFWIDSAPIKRFPYLERNVKVDVVVVGAGITGITTAHLLKETGLTVALIERERVASIDTGHTTAHLTYITDVELQELVRNFGKDHAQAAWDAGAAAIDEIERIVGEESIECEFTRVPAYVHVRVSGSVKKEASSLKKEADLAAKLGFDAAYLNSAPYFNLPAVRFANQAKFHPRKYLRSLVVKIPGSGSHVFEKSGASEFDPKKRRVKVNRTWISFA